MRTYIYIYTYAPNLKPHTVDSEKLEHGPRANQAGVPSSVDFAFGDSHIPTFLRLRRGHNEDPHVVYIVDGIEYMVCLLDFRKGAHNLVSFQGMALYGRVPNSSCLRTQISKPWALSMDLNLEPIIPNYIPHTHRGQHFEPHLSAGRECKRQN